MMNARHALQIGLVLGVVTTFFIEPPQAEAELASPDPGSVAVLRTNHADSSTSWVTYNVEHVSAWEIKFEDASPGLGEDGRDETDTFIVDVPNAGDSVTVLTKAGQGIATSISGEGDNHLDDNGFRVSLVDIDGSQYTITVRSEANTYALSHVNFTFVEGVYADAAYD